MGTKDVFVLIIFVVFALPSLLGVMWWAIKAADNPGNPDNIEKGAEIIAEDAIPWWLGILEWLAGLPGLIGALLVIGFVVFLKWVGEIR